MTDADDLIDRLCTYAGMIFEDVSEVALVRSASTSPAERAEYLRAAANDAIVIAQAAAVVARRYPDNR